MKIQKTLFSGKEIVVERTVPTVKKKIIFKLVKDTNNILKRDANVQ